MNDPQPIPDDPTAPKPWYTSKTVYLNALLTIIGVATFFAEPKNEPLLTVPSASAAVIGIGNVILRVWFTSAPIAGTARAYKAARVRAAAVTEGVALQLRARGVA